MAVLCFPNVTLLSDEGITILRLNISVPSTILSLVTGTLIVVVLDLAAKVAVMGLEL